MRSKLAILLCGAVLSCSGSALADGPEIDRSVGNDGVPVIKIKGDKTASAGKPKVVEMEPEEVPEAKAFRVYDLDGRSEESDSRPKVVVISNPPPVAPNPGSFFYGYGYPPVGGFYGPGFYAGPGFNAPFRRFGFGYRHGRFALNYQNAPLNYQNPPLNYQNPPLNYQNPPLNYQNPPINYQVRPLNYQVAPINYRPIGVPGGFRCGY